MTIVRWLCGLVIVGACSHAAPATTAVTPISAAPTCDRVATQLMSKMNQGAPEVASKFRALLVRRCTDDAWTETARACLVNMQSKDDSARCESELTEAQRTAVVQDTDVLTNQLESERGAPPTGGGPGGGPGGGVEGGVRGTVDGDMGAPPPPPPPPMGQPSPRSPQPSGGKGGKTSGDPCEGGQ